VSPPRGLRVVAVFVASASFAGRASCVRSRRPLAARRSKARSPSTAATVTSRRTVQSGRRYGKPRFGCANGIVIISSRRDRGDPGPTISRRDDPGGMWDRRGATPTACAFRLALTRKSRSSHGRRGKFFVDLLPEAGHCLPALNAVGGHRRSRALAARMPTRVASREDRSLKQQPLFALLVVFVVRRCRRSRRDTSSCPGLLPVATNRRRGRADAHLRKEIDSPVCVLFTRSRRAGRVSPTVVAIER